MFGQQLRVTPGHSKFLKVANFHINRVVLVVDDPDYQKPE